MDELSHEVKSLSELENLVEKNKKVLIYIGSDSYSFAVYRQLSIEFPDQKFYHSFSKVLNFKIIRKYSDKSLNERDIVAVIKSKSLLRDYDDKLFIFSN